jgi:uncharacterized protein YndB with AHSA1/START domain
LHLWDRIEKSVPLAAPVERVWRALTEPAEFGAWFRAELDAPFERGKTTGGRMTYPGYEHLRWKAEVETMEAPRLFSFRWHPYAIDPEVDYSSEPMTLVEFRLEAEGDGTRLTVTESGFGALPPHRRTEALPITDAGWAHQMRNIAKHLGG